MKYVILFSILFFVGCGNEELPTDKNLYCMDGTTEYIYEQEIKTNSQNVSLIYYKRLNNWVETHKYDTIITITDVVINGKTTGFIIVWIPNTKIVESITHTITIDGKSINVTDEQFKNMMENIKK